MIVVSHLSSHNELHPASWISRKQSGIRILGVSVPMGQIRGVGHHPAKSAIPKQFYQKNVGGKTWPKMLLGLGAEECRNRFEPVGRQNREIVNRRIHDVETAH